MRKLFEYNKKKLIASIILLALSMIFLLPLMTDSLSSVTKTDISPDTSFGLNLKELEMMREIYGIKGAKKYAITRFTYDLLWPIIYLFFLINMNAFLLNNESGRYIKVLKTLPIIAVFFDLFENAFCSIYFYNGQKTIGLLGVI